MAVPVPEFTDIPVKYLMKDCNSSGNNKMLLLAIEPNKLMLQSMKFLAGRIFNYDNSVNYALWKKNIYIYFKKISYVTILYSV
jgi:hypothetical protein